MPFGFTHNPLVALANSAICSFFRQIEVYGAENVPTEGPIILWVSLGPSLQKEGVVMLTQPPVLVPMPTWLSM